ncbi:IS66 family transposase [Xenorhabdus miraniensis]|uniref:Transposase n=1 Tax=Xenorhabdus miraniensis TaxID=351674 RepID=A0A2D0JJH4_9GAMM|nr:IS66 family transposase [Xenorhabdus miraniensis]PHM45576.1 transposase [Xenorhabdus miraniensis]
MEINASLITQDPDVLRQLAQRLLTDLSNERDKNHALLQRIQVLEAALKAAQRWRFGRKREAFHGEQRTLADEDTAADTADLEQQLTALLPGDRDAPPRSPKRRPLPPALPRQETRLELPHQHCPDCGQTLRFLRDEVSERLDYVPARFLVHRTIRPHYSCPCCETVHAKSLPPQLIEKGQPGPGLLAQITLAKACDHLPLYRPQKIYQRSGVDIPGSTLADWFGAVGAALKPLADALRQALLHHAVLQADETPLLLLNTEKGKSQKGYLWTYVSAADAGHPVVVYDCQPGRSGRYARARLAGWQGTLVVDGYAGYQALFEENGRREAGCWAHIRRKFFELYESHQSPLAAVALETIHELYRLERLIQARPPEQRRRWRQRYARPRLQDFRKWLLLKQQSTIPNSGIRKAIDHTLKRWPALQTYLDDGVVPIDNNRTENAIRPVAVGRKNWLFAGSLRAGQRLADILSLLETAKANQLDPFIWLRDVLTRLPTWPNSRLQELLPYSSNTFPS